MEHVLTEDQKVFLDLIAGCKVCKMNGSVWCDSRPATHKLAEELIAKGWLIETTEKHFAPGGKDRSFEITDKGMAETTWIQVSEEDVISIEE